MNHARRSLLAAPLVLALAPRAFADGISPLDQLLVDQAIAYLQGLTNAKGRFKQTDWKDGVATGTVYIARPGRARLEYDPPAGLLMICDGKTITVVNSRLKTVNRYPLSSSPLGLFLADPIRLDHGVQVLGVTRVYDGFSVIAADANHPGQGTIRLDFAQNPTRLAGWAIGDPQKRQTTVELQQFGPSGALPAGLFDSAGASVGPAP